MKIRFLIPILLLTFLISSAQATYYKMPNGKILNQLSYDNVKDNLSKNGKIEEFFLHSEIRNDSTINTVKLTVLQIKDENGNYFDPYSKQKENIGKYFSIEKFKKGNGEKYTKGSLLDRPTLINFWFTSCVPCIKEVPVLNKLKERFDKSINFIAITFDNDQRVQAFLKNKKFNFEHIVDSKQQIMDLGVEAYPMTILLDKEGIILNVYGELTEGELDEQLKVLIYSLK
ncbi:TlpA family protein disulfide reductase [Flavobacterium sp. XS1P32]|uniref:TlpA family protein disulfide reductase n=2 Tax=unclassified Flavobacterium TaxID=196869 RepID=UPI003AAC6B60